MDMEKARRVQEIAKAVVEKMGFPAEVTVKDPLHAEQEEFACCIQVHEDSNLLIGQHGVNLHALQHLIRLLAKRDLQENIHFAVDVNAYWEQKSQALVREAREAAEQALRDGVPILLRPMAGYERKIVHMELAGNEQVVTESVGEGEGRKVAVKPALTV
jgi:spoIIIJ-associated protein